MSGLQLGIADHLGWAIAITVGPNHEVVDRRKLGLVQPGLPAPIHHVGGPHDLHRTGEPLDDGALAALVADVRSSAVETTAAALDELQAALPEPIVAISLKSWPDGFPEDISVQRQVPYQSRADPIMYRQVLAQEDRGRDWVVRFYDAKHVERVAADMLGDRADEVLRGPRERFGPPWSKDHRMALAATIVAG